MEKRIGVEDDILAVGGGLDVSDVSRDTLPDEDYLFSVCLFTYLDYPYLYIDIILSSLSCWKFCSGLILSVCLSVSLSVNLMLQKPGC